MRGTSCQSNAAETGFAFSRFKNVWYYNSATECTLSKVNAVSLCILAKDFDPEKYKALCQLLTTVYAKSGDTVRPGQVGSSRPSENGFALQPRYLLGMCRFKC